VAVPASFGEARLYRYPVRGRSPAELVTLLRAALPLRPVDRAAERVDVRPGAATTAVAGQSGFGVRLPDVAGVGGVPALRYYADPAVVAAGAGLGGFAGTAAIPAQGWWRRPVAPIETDLTADEPGRAVLILAAPRSHAVIADALAALDTAPLQVVIEVAVAEVTLDRQSRFGLQTLIPTAAGDVTLSDVGGASTGPPVPARAPIARVFPGFSYGFSERSVGAVLNALENTARTRLLARERVLVRSGEAALIEAGDQVPVVRAVATGVAAGAIANSINYRGTGAILSFRPRINASGLVVVEIAQELSVVASSSPTIASATSPTFSTRRIATAVAVPGGQTLALGGLVASSTAHGKTGIPLLTRVPLLGGTIFGRTDNKQRRTELIILIQPTIVAEGTPASALP
jgi:general secretion pathway protein D